MFKFISLCSQKLSFFKNAPKGNIPTKSRLFLSNYKTTSKCYTLVQHHILFECLKTGMKSRNNIKQHNGNSRKDMLLKMDNQSLGEGNVNQIQGSNFSYKESLRK